MENLLLDQETKDRAGDLKASMWRENSPQIYKVLYVSVLIYWNNRYKYNHKYKYDMFPVGFLRARAGGDGYSFVPHS